jgi:hypothetical protein
MHGAFVRPDRVLPRALPPPPPEPVAPAPTASAASSTKAGGRDGSKKPLSPRSTAPAGAVSVARSMRVLARA